MLYKLVSEFKNTLTSQGPFPRMDHYNLPAGSQLSPRGGGGNFPQ